MKIFITLLQQNRFTYNDIRLSMPRNKKANETKLTKATSNGASLRTTVPAFIICSLGLNEGDIFQWNVENVDGSHLIEVRPLQKRIEKSGRN